MWKHIFESIANSYLSVINRVWIFHYLLLSSWTLLSRKAQDPEYFDTNKSIMSTNITLYLECFKDCPYHIKFLMCSSFPLFLFFFYLKTSCWPLHPCLRDSATQQLLTCSQGSLTAVLLLTKTHFHHYHFNKESDYWSSSNVKHLLYIVGFGVFLLICAFGF